MACLTVLWDFPFKGRRRRAWQNIRPPPQAGRQALMRGWTEQQMAAFSEWALANWLGHWALMIIGAPDTLQLIIYVYSKAFRSVMSGLSNENFSVHYVGIEKCGKHGHHQCPGKWCDDLQTVMIRPCTVYWVAHKGRGSQQTLRCLKLRSFSYLTLPCAD
jgi:hypothetical protein